MYPGSARVVACALHGQRQTSHAVTAAPSRAAAIATTPLPVHRSTAVRPWIPPICSSTSIRRCESCCGAYTPGAAAMCTRSEKNVVVTGPVPFSSGTCRDPSTALGSSNAHGDRTETTEATRQGSRSRSEHLQRRGPTSVNGYCCVGLHGVARDRARRRVRRLLVLGRGMSQPTSATGPPYTCPQINAHPGARR